jgi:hypothetical protein
VELFVAAGGYLPGIPGLKIPEELLSGAELV